MTACEQRQQPYLFKLKQTPNIKCFISQKMAGGTWVNAGQGWQGAEGFLKLETITSRPLLLQAVGKQVQHAGQKIIQVNSNHADFKKIQPALACVSDFFKTLRACAEQLNPKDKNIFDKSG